MFNIFMDTAFAQAADAAAKQPSALEMFAMPVGLVILMYFLIIRPQQAKAKEQQELLSVLKSGDEVVTAGGIIGKVKNVSDAVVTIDAGNGNQIRLQKSSIVGKTKK